MIIYFNAFWTDRMISMTDREYLEIVNKPILVHVDMYEHLIEDIQQYLIQRNLF
jgi:hypothetical protein